MAKLVMVQGYDRQQKEFTAFIMCNDLQMEQIEKAKTHNENFDLSNLNVVYKTIGHSVDQKTQKDIQYYYRQCQKKGR